MSRKEDPFGADNPDNYNDPYHPTRGYAFPVHFTDASTGSNLRKTKTTADELMAYVFRIFQSSSHYQQYHTSHNNNNNNNIRIEQNSSGAFGINYTVEGFDACDLLKLVMSRPGFIFNEIVNDEVLRDRALRDRVSGKYLCKVEILKDEYALSMFLDRRREVQINHYKAVSENVAHLAFNRHTMTAEDFGYHRLKRPSNQSQPLVRGYDFSPVFVAGFSVRLNPETFEALKPPDNNNGKHGIATRGLSDFMQSRAQDPDFDSRSYVFRISVMEYVHGQVLADIKNEETGNIIGMREKLELAMIFMWHSGIVHGDLTPTNVMVTTGGDVRIIDFGQSVSLTVTDGSNTKHERWRFKASQALEQMRDRIKRLAQTNETTAFKALDLYGYPHDPDEEYEDEWRPLPGSVRSKNRNEVLTYYDLVRAVKRDRPLKHDTLQKFLDEKPKSKNGRKGIRDVRDHIRQLVYSSRRGTKERTTVEKEVGEKKRKQLSKKRRLIKVDDNIITINK
jgi:serine/threonine protein kinase